LSKWRDDNCVQETQLLWQWIDERKTRKEAFLNYYFVGLLLEFELKASHLIDKRSTT
jgi:hypothetical protein